MDYLEFESHFPAKISLSLEKYVTNTVLLRSRYLFYKTAAGVQLAYCTHCNKSHISNKKLEHKMKDVGCPHCKSKCEVRAAGISRKYMEDKAVLVWYEKSVVNPQAITARVITVYRDYGTDFKNVTTHYNCSDMYLFEPGRSTFYTGAQKKAKTVYSAFEKSFGYGSWRKYVSIDNIRKAVKGTPFQYSTWEKYTKRSHYHVCDMVDFFDMAARYPCIEYLTKSGFDNMIWAKLKGESTYGAINWRGSSLAKVLRLTKPELKEIRTNDLRLSPAQLRFYQLNRSKGITISQACILADVHTGVAQDYYKEALKLASEQDAIKYILKQLRKGRYSKLGVFTVLSDWRDYRKQCDELGMDLKEERYLFPNDLHEAHMKTTKRMDLKENKAVDALIQSRLPVLQELNFQWKDLMIRPAESSFDLFYEGKSLIHCVGGYADRYAKGESDIFLIRKMEQPEKPFYTVEIQKRKILQCRGWDNDPMTDEVRDFVERFKRNVLNKKKNRKEVAAI